LGLYGSRSQIDTTARGTIDGFGGFGGLYGAMNLNDRNFILDYYAAASVGMHRFDLTFGETVPDDIDAEGSYNYWAAFGGVSLSGEREFDSFTLVPRAGLHLRHASAGSADVTASIPGYSESAELSIDDQSGGRFLGELGFEFERNDTDSQGEDTILRAWDITPGVYCDFFSGSETTTNCGARLGMEYSYSNLMSGFTFGASVDAEADDVSRRVSAGVFMERAIMDGAGTMNFGADVTQNGQPSLEAGVDINF